jgi:hypothetical protein
MAPENVSLVFLRACRSVNVSDFRFHDLRHTAESWMRMKGGDVHTVALILGHKDLRMPARYQHLSPAFLSDAVKLLDGAYAEPLKPLKMGQVHALSAPQRYQHKQSTRINPPELLILLASPTGFEPVLPP